ncbi:hypothetical protein PXD56_06215 [Maribacter sp. SA7]|uniref:hypothetical protein n=1 Tax=Maribacter zhoushanensis TaxID=3030012 RepID=UPI0023EDA58B|nr:hypothetical protein [Maribacter zhoushanensis]MDF4202537.1 hypothetical protein [Maribacter zhoushanensis]
MRYTIILLLGMVLFGCSEKKEEQPKETYVPKTELLSQLKNSIAGDAITISFSTDTPKETYKLQIKNAYGSVLLNATETETDNIKFAVPKNFTRIAGPFNWKLLLDGNILDEGTHHIATNAPKATYVESYFGPRSVTAGRNDFSMLTISPTDAYDNPLDDGTEVTIKYQFLENIDELQISTESFIAWYNVASTLKSGRILVTSECNGTTSKELATIVYPANAVNFSISSSSAHNFADGNQIVTFTSDIIKDEYGNTVTNGTLVTFVIKNEKDQYLYTIGTTINGVAEAKTLHPDKAALWEIQAFVTGAAESNTTKFEFKSAIKDYAVHFSKGNRNIDIGPFESFMKQLIPDGLLLQLDIYNAEGEFIDTKKTTSKNGVCNIFLGEHFLEEGDYILKLTAAGITKEFTKNIHGNTVK